MKCKNIPAVRGKITEEENTDLCFLEEISSAFTSTPVKGKDRRSISLLDISGIPHLDKSKINTSSETLGSTSSICKDSGYHQSESSLASDKLKEDDLAFDYRGQYFRLLDDLKFKDILIASLHESNHNLRMKIAEAENKISELRFKSQAHCGCCTNQSGNDTTELRRFENTKSQLKYSLTPFVSPHPCLLVSSTTSTSVDHEEPTSLPSDDAFSKVKLWQKSVETLNDRHMRFTNQMPTKVLSSPGDSRSKYIRPPEPLKQTMSYMATSRALAETYRRKQENADLFSFQLIGDHSVSVSPLDTVEEHQIGYNKNHYEKESKIAYENLPRNQGTLQNLLIRNQEQLKRSAALDSVPLQRFKAHSLNMDSNRLLECLQKASEYSATLMTGLSRLPNALDDIRSISH